MDLRRHALAVMVVLGSAAGAVHAKDKAEAKVEYPPADEEEVKLVRAEGLVITDGKGHYLAFTTPQPEYVVVGTKREVFYGDGKTFFRTTVKSFMTDSKPVADAEWGILDARQGLELDRSQVRLRDKKWTVTCRPEMVSTEMTPLPAADARKLLEKAAFHGQRMDRSAYALGRDGTTYYYVDVAASAVENKDFRFYVGKRGALKLQKLTDVTADSKGLVATTKAGVLRVNLKPTSLTWTTKQNKHVPLDALTIERNLELVFSELGVYAGKKFGVPCDDL